jgi:hypothetical protein
MRVQAEHQCGRAAARQRLDRIADRLLASTGANVEIRDVRREWTDDRLAFSFVAARGFFSATITGHVDVDEHAAALDAAIPPLVMTFVGEDRVRETLQRELERALADSSC